jgi:hypothetical protein
MLAKQQAENQQQQEHKQQQERKISKNKSNRWNAYHSRETSNGRKPATVRTSGRKGRQQQQELCNNNNNNEEGCLSGRDY